MKKKITKYGKSLDMREINRTIDWRLEIASDQKKLASKLLEFRNLIEYCPICTSTDTLVYVVVFEYPYHKCNFCGHIYCSTPPNNNSIENLYKSSSIKSGQSKIYLDESTFSKRVDFIARPKVDFISKVFESFCNDSFGKWLDIGSGAGEILFAAKDMGWDPLGVESDTEEFNFARQKGLNVINSFFSSHNCQNIVRGAKVISLFNVIEHISNPIDFLKIISNNMTSGLLVFEVPRHPSMSSLSIELFPEMACRHIYPPEHLHIFTDNSASILLQKTGFTLIGEWFFGQDFFDLITSAAANQGLKPFSIWDSVANLSPKIQNVIDHEGFADTMILVALRDDK